MQLLRLPDLLRGIAILFMIQVHIMEFYGLFGITVYYRKVSPFLEGPFTAIIFMIVIGYFVTASKKTV